MGRARHENPSVHAQRSRRHYAISQVREKFHNRGTTCECGQPKTPEARSCDRCAFLDAPLSMRSALADAYAAAAAAAYADAYAAAAAAAYAYAAAAAAAAAAAYAADAYAADAYADAYAYPWKQLRERTIDRSIETYRLACAITAGPAA